LIAQHYAPAQRSGYVFHAAMMILRAETVGGISVDWNFGCNFVDRSPAIGIDIMTVRYVRRGIIYV